MARQVRAPPVTVASPTSDRVAIVELGRDAALLQDMARDSGLPGTSVKAFAELIQYCQRADRAGNLVADRPQQFSCFCSDPGARGIENANLGYRYWRARPKVPQQTTGSDQSPLCRSVRLPASNDAGITPTHVDEIDVGSVADRRVPKRTLLEGRRKRQHLGAVQLSAAIFQEERRVCVAVESRRDVARLDEAAG